MNRPEAATSLSNPCHVVHLYGTDDQQMVAGAARYLAAGYEQGEGLLVVTTVAHEAALRDQLEALGVPVAGAESAGEIRFVDAAETLSALMIDGYPDQRRFDETVAAGALRMLAGRPGRRLRGFGEMVGLLWERGQFPSAIRLEQLWNGLQATADLDLYCAYPIDIFDPNFSLGVVGGLLCTHSAVVAAERNEQLDRALGRAIDACTGTDALRDRVGQPRTQARAVLPRAEDTILWIRSNLPHRADEILTRARSEYAAG
jgi:MEDS: MEthanogen/methylotroph, DcmR Sensory domain